MQMQQKQQGIHSIQNQQMKMNLVNPSNSDRLPASLGGFG